MITRRRLRPRSLDIADNLIAAFQRGKSARERGEPVTECHENPGSQAMQQSWKRGWSRRDKELSECQKNVS